MRSARNRTTSSATASSDIAMDRIVNGIKCYSPEKLEDYSDYPSEGFDVEDEMGEQNSWSESRTRLLKRVLGDIAGQIRRESTTPRKIKLLEVGCGSGKFLSALAGDVSLSLTGSEVYLKGLQSEKIWNSDKSVEFVQLDVERDAIPEKFDVIGAFDVLEHIPDDLAALRNVGEMLEEGGYFVITVPQYMFMWSGLDELVMHKRRYSRKELLSKLAQSGFTVEYCTSYLFLLFPLMLLSRMMDNAMKPAAADRSGALKSKVQFPAFLNHAFGKVMRIDEALIGRRIRLPFGGSLLVIARKPPLVATTQANTVRE